jgi:hypothetical protein
VCNDENTIINRIRITSYWHKTVNYVSIDLLYICGGAGVVLPASKTAQLFRGTDATGQCVGYVVNHRVLSNKQQCMYVTIQKYMCCYSLQE